MSSKINISVLLPTRGRTTMLDTCIMSLVQLAAKPNELEILLAFDHDDTESFDWFLAHIAPKLNDLDVCYEALGFQRLGYIRLNEYVNELAKRASGQWLAFWGDDAVVQTNGWDQYITQIQKFRVLRMPTHNQHPYAIFPIVPRAWVKILGYISPHQLTDSWVSQVAYMLDIMENIDVEIIHDRFDLTGNNNDHTFQNRPMLEGNPNSPKDFNHITWRQRRLQDATKINNFLREQGYETKWFDDVLQGKQDPWEKMISDEFDPNHQVAKFK